MLSGVTHLLISIPGIQLRHSRVNAAWLLIFVLILLRILWALPVILFPLSVRTIREDFGSHYNNFSSIPSRLMNISFAQFRSAPFDTMQAVGGDTTTTVFLMAIAMFLVIGLGVLIWDLLGVVRHHELVLDMSAPVNNQH